MKSALVTGGARGIGLATAKGLLAEGWQVAILDRDSEALAEALIALPEAIGFDADVSVPEDVARVADEDGRVFGGLDGMVNNGGVADFGSIRETTYERWQRAMRVH